MAKILIVDDDCIVRDALKVFLLRNGHQVETAADYSSGLQAFRAGTPDLVPVAQQDPLVSGSKIFKEIKRLSSDVPVMILTGPDLPEGRKRPVSETTAVFLRRSEGLARVLSEIDRLLGLASTDDAQGRPLILIAEDDDLVLRVLRKYLRGEGYGVITAADGVTAEELAKAHRPDIVLLDIFLPRRNGVEVLKTLSRELPGTGVMMISGNADEEIARDCLGHGAYDYFAKPASLEAVGMSVKGRLFIQGLL